MGKLPPKKQYNHEILNIPFRPIARSILHLAVYRLDQSYRIRSRSQSTNYTNMSRKHRYNRNYVRPISQGEKGEQFVIEYEKKRLANHQEVHRIQSIARIDYNAGYDIMSFQSPDSIEYDRFIEVKTYRKTPYFYWSINQRTMAKMKGQSYFLYIVDMDKIHEADYTPIIIQNPIEWFRVNAVARHQFFNKFIDFLPFFDLDE